ASGALEVLSCASAEERALFLDLTARLDDGEAAPLALAAARDLTLATDEKKTRRIAGQIAPGLSLLWTTQLLREAIAALALDETETQRLLQAVRRGGRFKPPVEDPNREWWL